MPLPGHVSTHNYSDLEKIENYKKGI